MIPTFISPAVHPCLAQAQHVIRSTRPRLPGRVAPMRRAVLTAQVGGIESVPAEKIPQSVDEIPEYWHRPGVYGVYDTQKELQYVAAVTDVGNAIATHIKVIQQSEKRFAVRMLTVDHEDDAPLGQLAENWVVAHFTDGPGVPPGNSDIDPDWRLEERVPLSDVYLMPDTPMEFIEMEIRRVLRENRVVLFMKGVKSEPLCGFSDAVVQIMDDTGVEYVCVNVLDEERNTNLREGIKAFSKWPTLPQLYIDGEFIGGAEIVRDYYESGELDTMVEAIIADTESKQEFVEPK